MSVTLCSVMGLNTALVRSDTAVAMVTKWANNSKGYYICAANVHMCMEAFDDLSFQTVVNGADLIVADGRPVVWAQRFLGYQQAQQVRGMDLMLSLCEQAGRDGTSIGFYGGSAELLESLIDKLQQYSPRLNVVCRISPPFRELSPEEDGHYVAQINDSRARILFVGLGCPKQERWMAEHKDRLHCVMLGVGAAFDFIAGNKRHAPRWMQFMGLEWLFRLIAEPKRLWRRYLILNPRFIWYFSGQLLRHIRRR